MDLQTIIVTIVLAACVAYTLRRLWRRFTAPPAGDPHCEGCPLAYSCRHQGEHTVSGECCKGKQAGCCCHKR